MAAAAAIPNVPPGAPHLRPFPSQAFHLELGGDWSEWWAQDQEQRTRAFRTAQQFMGWFFTRFRVPVEAQVCEAWASCFNIVAQCDKTRSITIHVAPQGEDLSNNMPTVSAMSCDAQSDRYKIDEWTCTGSDFEVQAVVASRPGGPEVTRKLCLLIDEYPQENAFGVYCLGGIHRSMAVAAITRMLAYPNAVFFIYARRTREMAAWRRLPLGFAGRHVPGHEEDG